MKITDETTIGELIPEGYEYSHKGVTALSENNGILAFSLVFKKKQPTAEEQANKLGFNIDDKVWNKYTKEYENEIIGFDFDKKKDLILILPNNEYVYPSKVTNKVSINTPTKEDFEFICNKLGYEFNAQPTAYQLDKHIHIQVNSHSWSFQVSIPNDLKLTVDEYMKSIEEKPVLTTEDGKKIYEGMEYWVYDDVVSKYTNYEVLKVTNASCVHTHNSIYSKYFKTEQAAKDYIEKQTMPQYRMTVLSFEKPLAKEEKLKLYEERLELQQDIELGNNEITMLESRINEIDKQLKL